MLFSSECAEKYYEKLKKRGKKQRELSSCYCFVLPQLFFGFVCSFFFGVYVFSAFSGVEIER